VDVTVVVPAGTSAISTADHFTYTVPPTAIATISPPNGPLTGGTLVTITGVTLDGATGVSFGGIPGTNVTVVSSTELTVISPSTSVAGTVDVTVTTPSGTTSRINTGQYTYGTSATSITSISPSSGPLAGGTEVTITGTGIGFVSSVTFGGVAALTVEADGTSDNTVYAWAPPGTAAGAVDVVVSTSSGTSATDLGGYTYAGSS
jgi:hypothetical protein